MLNTYREIALLNFISQEACGNCGFCQRNTDNIVQNKKSTICLFTAKGINVLFFSSKPGACVPVFLEWVVSLHLALE